MLHSMSRRRGLALLGQHLRHPSATLLAMRFSQFINCVVPGVVQEVVTPRWRVKLHRNSELYSVPIGSRLAESLSASIASRHQRPLPSAHSRSSILVTVDSLHCQTLEIQSLSFEGICLLAQTLMVIGSTEKAPAGYVVTWPCCHFMRPED